MKHYFSRLIIFLLMFVLLVSSIGAAAAGAGYSNISGHWAEETLEKAVNEGHLEGSGSSLDPDGPLTGAEMVSILTRVFSSEERADLSEIAGICPDDWYYDAASKAVALGIITPENNHLDLSDPISRHDAFVCLAEAFQLVCPAQDTSVLLGFSDGHILTGVFRPAVAALVAGGYIEGYGGALHINDRMTRAEFVTVLYKIASDYLDAGSVVSGDGNIVVSGDASLSGMDFDGSVFFDCSSSDILLRNVSAPAIVIRSALLNLLTLNSCQIGRVIIAAGSGDLNFAPNAANDIKTVVVGTGSGKIYLGGSISDVEITGDNRDVVINSSVNSLTVSGSGNRILINPGVTVASLKILTTAAGNTITVNGYCGQCDLYGPDTTVGGYGNVRMLTDNAEDSKISVNASDITVNENYGLNGVSVALSAPDDLPSYEMLEASVRIDASDKDIYCTGRWYLNDTLISSSEIDLGKTDTALLSFDATDYRSELPVTATLKFILSYSSPEGIYQEIRTEKSLTLESRNKFSAQEVLSLVKTGYKGDYTLAWAESNDFESILKEEWVNLKGYSSETDYLVWVSIAYQRVNVFTGSAGRWKLEKTFIVGTGAPGHATPTGVFSILAKRPVGWTTKQYTVKPLINFYSSAYAFHSRLYYPGTTTVSDARIGFPISHGCVRMYDEDVAYMYNTVPVDTTVVIY